MKTMEELRTQLEALKAKVHRDYGVSKMEVFGSYVRREQREDSDLDVFTGADVTGAGSVQARSQADAAISGRSILTPAVVPQRARYLY